MFVFQRVLKSIYSRHAKFFCFENSLLAGFFSFEVSTYQGRNMIENERPSAEVLSPGQEKVLLCLLQAGSIREASKQAEISEAQIYRYLKEPAFLQAYKTARRESLEVAIRRIEAITSLAVDTLREVLENKENTAGQRAGASKTVLDLAFKIQDNDILDRIEKLEGTLLK